MVYSAGIYVIVSWNCHWNSDFFNHFGKRRFSVDPTPIEVEMRLYENDLQTTLIENISRKEQELDVGTKYPTGSHRS